MKPVFFYKRLASLFSDNLNGITLMDRGIFPSSYYYTYKAKNFSVFLLCSFGNSISPNPISKVETVELYHI